MRNPLVFGGIVTFAAATIAAEISAASTPTSFNMKGWPPRATLVNWIRNFWGRADTTLFSMSSGLDSELARGCAAAGRSTLPGGAAAR
jgi:hypothetical protein